MVKEADQLAGELDDRQIGYLQCLIDGDSAKEIAQRVSIHSGTRDKFEERISRRLGEPCAEVGLAKAVRKLVWDRRLDTSKLPQELPGLNDEERKVFSGLFNLETVEEIGLSLAGAAETLRVLLRMMGLRNQYQLVAMGAMVAEKYLARKAS